VNRATSSRAILDLSRAAGFASDEGAGVASLVTG
jgi:hypothetical protein